MTIRSWFWRQLARVEAASNGYLGQVGWFNTRATRLAKDAAGNPIPWFTYPAIRLLEERVRPQWRVLEFGAGMGTQWWCERVKEVVAVEHDSKWANHVSSQCRARVLPAGHLSAADYIRPSIGTGSYAVVIVDGLYRNECIELAPDMLDDSGIIVLDDAQRPEYGVGIDHLRSLGFRVLPLHGPQPVSKHPGCTAIFYRDGNILGL